MCLKKLNFFILVQITSNIKVDVVFSRAFRSAVPQGTGHLVNETFGALIKPERLPAALLCSLLDSAFVRVACSGSLCTQPTHARAKCT